jgi:hypothetical protein
VLSYPLGLLAFAEEHEVGFDARASGRENTAGETDNAVNAALLKELALGLNKGDFVGAEQDAFVQDDAALAVLPHALKHMLEEKDLGGASLVLKLGLGFLAFLAAKGRVHEDIVKELGRVLEKVIICGDAREGVAMPQMWLVHAVQDEVG